jgi:transposase
VISPSGRNALIDHTLDALEAKYAGVQALPLWTSPVRADALTLTAGHVRARVALSALAGVGCTPGSVPGAHGAQWCLRCWWPHKHTSRNGARGRIPDMPRPSLLTPERSERILGLLRSGVFIETACQACGIGTTTYFRWLKNADDPDADPMYREFRDATTCALARAQVRAIELITLAGHKDWRAAAWFLERSFPEKYGRRLLGKLEHTGKDGGPITLASLSSLMFDADAGETSDLAQV